MKVAQLVVGRKEVGGVGWEGGMSRNDWTVADLMGGHYTGKKTQDAALTFRSSG
jgi:hypothetical protein